MPEEIAVGTRARATGSGRTTWGAALAALAPLAAIALGLSSACSGETGSLQTQAASSCMLCHNGSLNEDYSGPGIENPHPFAGASQIMCTTCHGGNPQGTDMLTSHVPPPPEIGDDVQLENDAKAYFNRLTLAGIDKFADYQVAGTNYTALDYLQFINPGDVRVAKLGRGCGQCHAGHAEEVNAGLLYTEAGIMSNASYTAGEDNYVAASQGLHEDTAADFGFRAVQDPDHAPGSDPLGSVSELLEDPVYSEFGVTGPLQIFNNNAYNAAALNDDVNLDGSVITNSPLANLFREQVAFTCGDCHLGSAGANNRAADFRSSGCSACHMQYSLGGKSGSSDPNIDKLEPANPDDIDDPERPHARKHQLTSIAQTLPDGTFLPGIDDYACVGCHQGSNRTVLQYWGIRLDQNADVVQHNQYPADPVTFATTHNDTRLYDPVVGNNTFNGRNGSQYLLREDYDGDGRDDTPPDVHYDAGLGCIDCHGSFDLHGGDVNVPGAVIASHMEQQVAIRCESCHGTAEAYAATVAGTTYEGTAAQVAVDGEGHPLRHVTKDASGNYWLKSRLDGAVHFLQQTRDVVVNSGKLDPLTSQAVYSAKASYAMGRADGVATNGIGPQQNYGVTSGFSHSDTMECVACHGSWTNTCMGCHLSGEYNTGNNFSNITGERIVYRQRTADFTYQSPLFFQLGVGPRGKITTYSANTKVNYQWEDRFGNESDMFQFTDRNGQGNDPGKSSPSLSHNAFMAHSIRGKVAANKEGPRYCAACHLTTAGMAAWETPYRTFRDDMAAGNWGNLNFTLLRTHFGLNTGNQLGSPFFAHMAAGLGTGMFLFNENGGPVNPIDDNPNRVGALGVAPASAFNPANVAYDLDRIVEPSGVANGSNNHAWLNPAVGPSLRDGALDPELAGPLGATLIERLSDPDTGIILDSWLDANGASQGSASTYVGGP